MAFTRPDVIRTPLTNRAYGFPTRGARRRVKPTQLGIIHITGNRRTAAMRPPRRGTRAEIAYMDRADSPGPSAHTYASRDGALFMCINARKFAAWSNGDLVLPDRSKPYVREMVRKRARYNPNELVFREYECTGSPSGYPLTKAQKESVAYQLAVDSIATGLPITPLVTVGIHAHINTRDRRLDPFKRHRVSQLKAICERAKVWKRHLLGKGETPPPELELPDPVPPDEEPTLDDLYAAALGHIEALEAERDAMRAAFVAIGEAIDPFDEEDTP